MLGTILFEKKLFIVLWYPRLDKDLFKISKSFFFWNNFLKFISKSHRAKPLKAMPLC
jgi:hypothetical protein